MDQSNLLERAKASYEKRKNDPIARRQFLVDAKILDTDGNYTEFFLKSNKEVVNMAQSGIKGYVHTKTSMTIQFTNGDTYRYDVSKAFSQAQLAQMVKLAEKGSGLNSFLNANPDIKRYGFLDNTLRNASYKAYGKA